MEEWRNRGVKTNYSNSSPLVDATDHCSPKPQKQFLPPRRLTTEQLTHCSIYIYIFIPALLGLSTSSLHYCCNISQLLYIAIPPCIYFLKLLGPLHCCTVCFVL